MTGKTRDIPVKLTDLRESAPMTAAFAAIGACWGSFAAQVPVLKAQIGASDSMFGVAMLIASIGAVAAMWSAPAIERWLGGPAMKVLSVGMVLVFLVPGMATTVWVFAVSMMVVSMFTGTLDVVMNARVSALEAKTGRSIMGFEHGMFSLSYAISALMTGFARAAGWPPVMIFAGVMVAVLVMTFMVGKSQPSVGAPSGQGDTQNKGGLLTIVLLAGGILLIAFMAEQSTEAWSALHLERTLGAGAIGGALGPTLLGATMAIGRFSGQAVVNRIGAVKLTYVASVVTATGAFMAAFALSIPVAYAGFIILGFGVSVIVPMGFVIVGRVVSNEDRTWAISRITAFGYAGFFFGPPIMGFLSEWYGLDAAFAFVGCTLLVVPVLAYLLSKRAS